MVGGNVPQMKGYFFNPTVIGKVTPDMSISREEVFGPVAPIIAARNPIEAIRFANDTEFGLGSSIWSEKFAKENNLVKDIEAGMVFVNSMVFLLSTNSIWWYQKFRNWKRVIKLRFERIC